DGDGVTQFVIDAATPGVTVVPLDGLDLTRRFADVRFDDVTVPAAVVLGPPGDAQARVDAQLDVAAALTVAESAGAVAALVRSTVASASRGSTICTSTCGASPPTACSTAIPPGTANASAGSTGCRRGRGR